MSFLIGALLLAVAIGGGVAAETQQALPGDAFYPLKVNVEEPIEIRLTHGDIAQAQLDIAFAQTRLGEAQMLAKENKLDAAAQSEVTQSFDSHVQSASIVVANLETQGDYQGATTLADELQTMLTNEVGILQDASSQGSIERQVSLVPILVETRKALASASATGVDASAKAVAANITNLKSF
jgi:hypothetical protein